MKWKSYLNASSEKPVVPFIVGPTASGKTAHAIEMAGEVGGEVVSADSMQIYRHMDIGTAKATPEERALVPHHMIDIIEPDEDYSVADYAQEAGGVIQDILERGKTPIVCGGTGLYVNAISKPFSLNEQSADQAVRERLEREMAERGTEALYKRLTEIDPETARIVHPNNKKRVIRALEIFEVTGKPKSALDREAGERELWYEPVLLAPQMDREIIYDRINARVDAMIEQGLLDEVRGLESRYGRGHTSMQAIGYKEFFPFLDGDIPLEEAVRILKRDTRHYAKRQLTWFRHDPRIIYF